MFFCFVHYIYVSFLKELSLTSICILPPYAQLCTHGSSLLLAVPLLTEHITYNFLTEPIWWILEQLECCFLKFFFFYLNWSWKWLPHACNTCRSWTKTALSRTVAAHREWTEYKEVTIVYYNFMDGCLCHPNRNYFWWTEIVWITYAVHSADIESALKQLSPTLCSEEIRSFLWCWFVISLEKAFAYSFRFRNELPIVLI